MLQEELDLVLADSGLGSATMIGSELGDELLVMLGGFVWRMMRTSREVAETPPALGSIPLDPFDDSRARGSEDSGGKGGVLSIGQEELHHGSADGLRVLGVSDTLIV